MFSSRRRRKINIFKLALWIIVLCLLGYFFFHHTTKPTVVFTSQKQILTSTVIPTNTPLPNSQALQQAVQGALQATTGTYAIVIENLATAESYTQNAQETFSSASLYKLWVMTVVEQEIQSGVLKPTDILSKDLGDLAQEFDITIDPTESQTSGILSMSVSDALYQMITISDNNAALLLTDKIGLSNLQAFLQKNDFSHSKLGIDGDEPTTTASDIALFFDKLYKGELANTTQTQDMINLLKEQRLNEKIPLNLPDNTPIAHKTGEIDNYSHDAGIVYSPHATYIIVVLTQSDDPQEANNRIANVSQAVYNYFNPTH